MERRLWWMAVLLVAALGVSCGGDDSGGDDDEEGGRSGGGSNQSGASGGGMIGGEGVVCGDKRCTMPEGSMAEPCCMDPFEGVCGMMGGFGGTACTAIVPVDTRCPSVSLGPIMLPSCCTDDNMCGINGQMFGGDCTELGEAERMAMERTMMFMDEDGGVPGGPGGGFTIDFPDPQACE